MPTLPPVQPTTFLREIPGIASDRPLVRILLVDDGHASASDFRWLIAADPDLLDLGQPVAAHEALQQAHDLLPDVVVLDRTLSRDVVLLARDLTSLDRPPAIVLRSACPEPTMTIAAIVAGVSGIVSRGDPSGALCDAIRWVAGNRRWLPDIPLWALSGSRLDRHDLPLLLMLLRGAPLREIAADLGITPTSVHVRRLAMLREMLSEPPPASSHRARRASESSPVTSEADPRIAVAA
jgi:two-component system, NarL family, uhpT operon response regulator UhpA